MANTNIVFAGDRRIAVEVLSYLADREVDISALILPNADVASHDDELREVCIDLDDDRVLRGEEFREQEGIDLLESVSPDYVVSVHFSHIYPTEVLEIPSEGVVNLHPAYLPYNRGWHTPTWAIWEETPYGATIHFMDEHVDAGDVISRKRVEIRPEDTADTLYNRALNAERELFEQTWPKLVDFSYRTKPQCESVSTTHKKEDIETIREIDLDGSEQTGALLRKLRALTTNQIGEAAYFEKDGERYSVQVDIIPLDGDES